MRRLVRPGAAVELVVVVPSAQQVVVAVLLPRLSGVSVSSVIRRSSFAAPLALLLLAGCASKPAGAPAPGDAASPSARATPRPRQDQQLITRDVILGTQYTNLYDVVLAMRPNWFNTRGARDSSNGDVLEVYLDTQRIGGVNELRNISPTNVQSVRYFDPVQSAARWGMGHTAGAIYVLTAK
jgi:hypothetical protein